MRKYQTEFGLNVHINYKTVIPPSHLKFVDNDDHKYHIYGILLTPKFFCVPESIVKYPDHFDIRLFSNSFDQYQEYTLSIRIDENLNHEKIIVKSTYPCSVLKITIEDDEWVSPNNTQKEFEIQTGELFDFYANYLMDRISPS